MRNLLIPLAVLLSILLFGCGPSKHRPIDVYLTVESEYGSPNPPVGSNYRNYGTHITASVISPVLGLTGTRYVCTGWIGTGSAPETGDTNLCQFVITENSTITWLWKTQYELSVTASPLDGGTIECLPEGPWYDAETSIQLEAVANPGYCFVNWSGDLSGTANPQTLTMDAPKSGTANFIPIFVKTWGGSSGDSLYAVAVDSTGNIYCAGVTYSFGAGGDALLLKYDSSGTLQWAKTWSGSSWDILSAVAVDSAGNIYCAGYFGAGYSNALLLKYDSSGALQWAKTWGGSSWDILSAVAVDSAGNIYCAGYTDSFGAGVEDALLLKYNSSGALAWANTWGGSDSDYLSAVAVDSAGNIYCAGHTDSFGAGYEDALLLKYNSLGTLQWVMTWGGSDSDRLDAVAVDSAGNIYCAGFSRSFGTGWADALLLKYNSSGALQWAETWGDGSGDDLYAVAVDSAGNVYCAGGTASFGTGGWDALLLKYNSSGTLQLAKTWGGSSTDWLSAVAVDSTGNIYLGGSTDSYTGVWQEVTTGTQRTPSGSESSPAGTAGSPSATQTSPTGTQTSPTGSETGAGGYDTLLLRN